MMKRHFLATLTCVLALAACNSVNINPLDYVDPFVGTGAHGHTFPGATTPFGMVQLSPDTRNMGWDACSGYHYSDTQIHGFSHTHLSGTGCADLTDFLFCPYIGAEGQFNAHSFSHGRESARPGLYSVSFDDCSISCELTALPRTGVHRYSFGAPGSRQLLVDLGWNCGDQVLTKEQVLRAEDKIFECMHVNDGWISGHCSYLSASFSAPIQGMSELGDGRYLLDFGSEISSLEAWVGLSFSSVEAAAANREADMQGLEGFDAAAEAAARMWQEALSCIQVDGGSRKSLTNLYTALYHTMICPNLISDAAEQQKIYSTISIWDTYRAWNPLMSLLNTELQSRLIACMLDFYRANGELPIWPLCDKETNCMIGYHSVSMIADAYLNGDRTFDAELALEAMVRSSNINAKASDKYISYDYVPADLKRESVSLTLEYSYDDWCIARMAEAMGRSDIAAEYYRRARNYMNLYDGGSGFFRGKNANGSWAEPFCEYASDRAFTEAIPWQYRFAPVHDVAGLAQLMGGRQALEAELDRMFADNTEPQGEISDMTGLVGQYAHGNEPSHHVAYLYDYLGSPWKTQEKVKMLMNTMYSPDPEGICGNEDCGQMSAWFVLSAMGLYSVCPGSGEFAIGSPLFGRMSVRLANGRTLSICCDKPSLPYVADVSLNGCEIDRNFLSYAELMEGGELSFRMSATPVERAQASEPYSMSTDGLVAMPWSSTNGLHLFEGSIDIDLNPGAPGAQIRYTTDGSTPGEDSPLYTEPLHIDGSCTIKARCWQDGSASRTLCLRPVKAEYIQPAKVAESALAPGLAFSYYTGEFSKCCQISSGKLCGRGTMAYPSIKNAPDADHFGYIFEGYVRIPAKGVWEFATISDDGSMMLMDGQMVVDNDGSHAADLATGRIALDEGWHHVQILYFEDYEGEDFDFLWKQGDGFVHIPENNLKH